MRKRNRKLQLHKETLRTLGKTQLEGVVAGDSGDTDFCTDTCIEPQSHCWCPDTDFGC